MKSLYLHTLKRTLTASDKFNYILAAYIACTQCIDAAYCYS